MAIKFKEPRIRVIEVLDNRDEVWRISRPHLKITDAELMNIRKVDLPVQSFAYVNFEITGSILLRDVLYHVRPSSDWARSNRTTVINKETLFYSSEYQDGALDEERWEACTNESENLDTRKDKFPYMVSTDFCWGCDLRTLSTVLNSMEVEIPIIYEIYGEMFKQALRDHGINELPPGRKNYFSSLAIPGQFCTADEVNKVLVSIDRRFDTVTIQYRGKGSLLSQFIRQHIARVRSSFITRLMNKDAMSIWDTSELAQDELFDMQVITTIEGAKKLISTRACYFAKFDMASRSSWSDIITELIRTFGGGLQKYIPCVGQHELCPWKTEQLARCIAGNPNGSTGEVNPPCPYITGLPESIKLRKAKFNSNSSLFHLWETEGPQDLELTEYGRQYLENIELFGFAEECDNNNPEMRKIAEELIQTKL